MYCENCGLRLPDWAHYCERCGFPVAAGVADDAQLESTNVQAPQDVASDDIDNEAEVVTTVLNLDEIKAAMAKAKEADETQSMAVVDDAEATDEEAGEPKEPSDDDLDDDLDDDEDFEDDDLDEEELDEDEDLDEDELDDEDDFEDDYDEEEQSDVHPASKTGEYAAAHYYDDEIEDEWSRRYAANPWQQPGAVGYVGTIAGNADDDESGGVDPAIRYYHGNAQQRQQISKWRQSDGGGVSSLAAYGIAAAAVIFGIIFVSVILAQTRTPGAITALSAPKSTPIAQEDADRIIKGLDGWWKTNRTFDGRIWHIENSKLKTYGADGVLAEEELINDKSVERMTEAPADIGGGGYYLRSVALFLRNDDPDTLYAILQDGKSSDDANLHRTEKPDMEFTDERKEKPEDTSEDFILPDSDKRYYETEELQNLSDHDLYLARNELFARHGYVFLEGGELAERFGAMSWYKPNENFDRSMFNEFERRNVNTIYALEQSRSSAYL